MTKIDASELWDRWISAKQGNDELSLDEFCRTEGDGAADLLRAMLAVESESPPSPLLDLLVSVEGRRIFAGHELDRVLGQGGAGVVFLARRISDGAEVALKVLNPLLAAVAGTRNVVLREAEIAARLQHPGIVAVLKSGVERGYAWVASELCRGVHADAWVGAAESNAQRIERALSVGRQAARALGHAHSKGIVHRDVTAQNVLVEPDGTVRILDFGLARADGVAFAISRSGDLVGTPLYMAPEQVRGDNDAVGPWTDVHALGLLLWELATGERLADRGAHWRELSRAGAGRLRLARRDIALLPASLQDVVARCAEPDPRDRPLDGNELADELDHIARAGKPRMRRLTAAGRIWRGIRRKPARALATGFTIVAIASIGTYAWRNRLVDVYFDEERGGKTLWIDGELVGSTGIALQLRPGEHSWRAQYEPGDVYGGVFVVESGRPLRLHLVLDHPNGCPTLPNPFEISAGRWAWVQVSTPEPTIELEIDGTPLGQVPGIVAVRVPFGTHTFRLGAPSKRERTWTADVRDQQLLSFSYQLDPADSDWRTHVVYSPIETSLRDHTLRSSGARLYYENQQIAARGTYADRAYLGQRTSSEPAALVIEIRLEVIPKMLQIEVLWSALASTPTSWSRVEVGWRDGDWTLLHESPLSRLSGHFPSHRTWVDEETNSNFVRPEQSVVDDLLQSPNRSDRLLVRWSCGGAPAGGADSAMAQMLRTEALPARLENGVLHWSPAFVVRVSGSSR